MWDINARRDHLSEYTTGCLIIPLFYLLFQPLYLVYKMMREWEEKEFDAIITIASPMPAISPDLVSSVITGACYTAVYNLTGCPAGNRMQI